VNARALALYLETQAPACHRRRTLSFGVPHVTSIFPIARGGPTVLQYRKEISSVKKGKIDIAISRLCCTSLERPQISRIESADQYPEQRGAKPYFSLLLIRVVLIARRD
jgi:hypothetical protein